MSTTASTQLLYGWVGPVEGLDREEEAGSAVDLEFHLVFAETQRRNRYFPLPSRSGRLGGAAVRRLRDKQPASSTIGEPDSGRCARWIINTQQKEEEEASETLC